MEPAKDTSILSSTWTESREERVNPAKNQKSEIQPSKTFLTKISFWIEDEDAVTTTSQIEPIPATIKLH